MPPKIISAQMLDGVVLLNYDDGSFDVVIVGEDSSPVLKGRQSELLVKDYSIDNQLV